MVKRPIWLLGLLCMVLLGAAGDAVYNNVTVKGNVLSSEQVIENLEPGASAKDVRFATRQSVSTDMTSVDETGGLYIRVSPDSASDPVNGIYIETSPTNSEQSTGIKLIHRGLNDGIFIAGFEASAALETAGFKNGTTGFISTVQWEAPDTEARDFGNSTLFNGVWGDDGTGGATVPANFGMMYMTRSLGHSVRTRLQDPLATGWAWGRVEWAISSWDLTRNHFDVFNLGIMNLRSRVAGGASVTDAEINITNAYWSGTSDDKSTKLHHTFDGSGNPITNISSGADGSESLDMQISQGRASVGGALETSAALSVQSTTGAFLLPRMTETQRDALTAANGMIIYNTTTDNVDAYEAGSWGAL